MHNLISAVMMLAACALIGNAKATSLLEHLRTLEAIKEDMTSIKLEMRYSADTLSRMLPRMSGLKLKRLWTIVADKVSDTPTNELWEIIAADRSSALDIARMTDDDIAPLKSFIYDLGSSDISTQEKKIELSIAKAEEVLAARKKEITSKAKVIRTLGLLAGVAGAIIML